MKEYVVNTESGKVHESECGKSRIKDKSKIKDLGNCQSPETAKKKAVKEGIKNASVAETCEKGE